MENKELRDEPIGVYKINENQKIYVYSIIEGVENRIIVGDNFSGKNPRSFKLYKNTIDNYFLYRGEKVYLSKVESLK